VSAGQRLGRRGRVDAIQADAVLRPRGVEDRERVAVRHANDLAGDHLGAGRDRVGEQECGEGKVLHRWRRANKIRARACCTLTRPSERETMRTLLAALFVAVLSSIASTQAAEREALVIAQAKDAPIDINRAKADELMTLKGIGEVRAAAIIKGRPYARKDELVQKKILPDSVYNEIKDKIIAKQ